MSKLCLIIPLDELGLGGGSPGVPGIPTHPIFLPGSPSHPWVPPGAGAPDYPSRAVQVGRRRHIRSTIRLIRTRASLAAALRLPAYGLAIGRRIRS